MPGVPSVYYGSEYGLKGVKGNGTDLPLRPELEFGKIDEQDDKLFELIKRLGNIRINSEALRYGDYEQVVVKNEQFIFSRNTDNDRVFVILNLSDKESVLEFKLPFEKGIDLLDENEIVINANETSIVVPAFSGKIITELRK
jgi:glycosidase